MNAGKEITNCQIRRNFLDRILIDQELIGGNVIRSGNIDDGFLLMMRTIAAIPPLQAILRFRRLFYDVPLTKCMSGGIHKMICVAVAAMA